MCEISIRRTHSARINDHCLGADRCNRCRSECPVGAIGAEGRALRVDPRTCISCGRCVTTCPTAAISMPGADLAGLAAEVDTLLAAGVADVAVTCDRRATADRSVPWEPEGGPQAVVSLPCVALLGPGARLGLLASGIRLRVDPCDECRCLDLVEADTRFADQLLSLFGSPGRTVERGAEGGGGAPTWSEPAATNAVLAAMVARSGGRTAVEHPVLDGGAPTRVVQVEGARCTVCGACALACPSSALIVDEATRTLAVDSSQCVACGRCVTICRESAVAVERGVDIGAVVHGPTPVLRPSRTEVCPRCGATVAADPLVASVERRLTAQGRPPALIASLHRCPACVSTGA